jgi:predicted lipoprotein
MKKIPLFLLLGLPLTSFAQQPPGFSQDQMAKLMQQAQEMQSCVQNIDQAAMQAFEERAKKMGAEMKALCAAGKRDAAIEKAMEFGRETAQNPALAEVQKCGEGMRQIMPSFMPEISKNHNDAPSKQHPCDNLND